MKGLDAAARRLARDLDALDRAREAGFSASREVVRHSGSAIKAAHRGEDTRPHLDLALKAAARMVAATRGHVALEASGFAEMAWQELVEAHLVDAVRRGAALPTHAALGAPAAAYVLGLGDLVGELRRFALDALVRGETDVALARLADMEDAYQALMGFDYPTAVVDARRKQDAARGMLERTRGEIAIAVRSRRLEEKLDRAAAPRARRS